MGKARKPPPSAARAKPATGRHFPVAGLCVAVAVAGMGIAAFKLYGSTDDGLPVSPSRTESDEQGSLEVYDHSSFVPTWGRRDDATDSCWRTDEFHGVPFSVDMASEELDMDALTAYLLEKAAHVVFGAQDAQDKCAAASAA